MKLLFAACVNPLPGSSVHQPLFVHRGNFLCYFYGFFFFSFIFFFLLSASKVNTTLFVAMIHPFLLLFWFRADGRQVSAVRKGREPL